tara:strand:- start:1840 stop:2715 length:876 start_codon:yes stop_codon:yes gene_type:complete
MSKNCKPENNSILSVIKNKSRKTLIIILDGYPVASVYKDLASEESRLHMLLKEESIIYGSNYTLYDRTGKSLAYLLAGIKYKSGSNCTYPYFSNNIPINFANSSQFYSQDDSLCNSRFSSIKELIGIAPFKILNELTFLSERFRNVYTEKLSNKIKECSIANNKIQTSLNKWILNNSNLNKGNPFIFHDVYFHQKYFEFSRYPIIDSQYLNTIKSLISIIKSSNSIDDLIIMSDHGPRTFSNPMQKKLKEHTLVSSTRNMNENGYFISYIPISSNNNELLRVISKHAKYKF